MLQTRKYSGTNNCHELEELTEHFQNIFIPKFYELDKNSLTIHIGEYLYKKNCILEEISDLFSIIKERWYRIQDVVLNNNSILYDKLIKYRKEINVTFEAVIESLQMVDCPDTKQKYITDVKKYIEVFSSGILPISEYSEDIQIKIATLSTGNAKCPIYQYFHSYIDVKYYINMLEYVCGMSTDNLERNLKNILDDFLIIWSKMYKRYGIKRSIFVCDCMKTLCLLIQILCEKVTFSSEFFWNSFNNSLKNIEPIVSLWILRDIATLQNINYFFQEEENTCERIKPNYTILETKLKELLTNANSEVLANSLRLIEPLVCKLWLKNSKIEIYQTLWDFFSKRLNVSIKTTNINSSTEFLTLLDTIIYNPKDCNGDFELFLGMLVSHLRSNPNHWSKIKGRIYSQLGPNKIKDLTDVGMLHTMTLFIVLSTVNYDEISKKFVGFVQNLPSDKKSSHLVWNIYAAFLIKNVTEDHSIENNSVPIIQMLQSASSDQKQFSFIKDFMKNFETIISSSSNMCLHQWLLLNSWLGKYLSVCYYQDLNKALEIIMLTLEKCSTPDSWNMWENCFKEFVYPHLKTLALSQTAPPILGKIVATLCLLMPNLSADTFNYFNNDNISPKVIYQFLVVILDKYPGNIMLSAQQERIIIQSWVRICLLTVENVENLTQNILKLDILQNNLKKHIKSSKDPIYAIIEFLSSDISQHIHSENIGKLCELIFGNLDRWLPNYLNNPDNEAIVYKIYTYISIAFLNCGPLLYNRNKTVTPLTRLVQTMLLPTEFLIGKKQLHDYVLKAIKKTWHIFFESFVKLKTVSDSFLERTLRDLITKYMQFFSTSESPILKCLENENLAEVTLEKINSSYFKHPVKEPEACMLKALKILSDFVQSTTSINLLKIVINNALTGLFDVIIYHSQRSSAISVVKTITMSSLYVHVKCEFRQGILSMTESNLAFNTTNYFQLMYILAKFVPEDIKLIMENIKVQVSNVERKRGVGFDNNLRSQLEKLEKMLNSTMFH